MDCKLPGFSVYGIFQARVLEWVAISFSNFLSYSFWNNYNFSGAVSGAQWKNINSTVEPFALTTSAKEAEVEWFYKDLQGLLEFTRKRCPFHYRWLECKSRKSRDTWSNRQAWPWISKWSRAKANRVLSRERTGHSKCPVPTTQETTLHMDITRWSILKSDWLFSLQLKMEKLYTGSKNKTGSWLWLRVWTPYWKFMLKLKRVEKTTRPFRYDPNHILYDYTVEMTNRFKGLDLIDRAPEELGRRFVTLYRRQGSRTSPRKRNAKRWNGCLRRPFRQLRKEEKWK